MTVVNRRQLVKLGVVAVPSIGICLGSGASAAKTLSRLSPLGDASYAGFDLDMDVMAMGQDNGSCGGGIYGYGGGSDGGGGDGGTGGNHCCSYLYSPPDVCDHCEDDDL